MKIDILRERYDLDIDSPFYLSVKGELLKFDALIKGYGALKGMVVDSDDGKFTSISTELVSLGFGYSCFNINASDIEIGFEDVLYDWGVSNSL